jgi:hypothetical protein
MSMRALATSAAKFGTREAAARLEGFCAGVITIAGVRFRPPFEPADPLELARAALGDGRASLEREVGRGLSRDEALELVRSLSVG